MIRSLQKLLLAGVALYSSISTAAPTQWANVKDFLDREDPKYKVVVRASEGRPTADDTFPIISCVEGRLAQEMEIFNPQAPGLATLAVEFELPAKRARVFTEFMVWTVTPTNSDVVGFSIYQAAVKAGESALRANRLGAASQRKLTKLPSDLRVNAYVDDDGNSQLGLPSFEAQYIVEAILNPAEGCSPLPAP